MPDPSRCPAPEELRHLMLGELPGPQAEPLESHLAECECCGQTLHTLQAEDTLVEAVRARVTGGERLVKRLHGMPSGDSGPAGDLTGVTGPAAGRSIALGATLPPTPTASREAGTPHEHYD